MEQAIIQQATNQITVSQPAQSTISTDLRTRLTRDEVDVIEVGKKSPAFGRYGEIELLTEVALLIFKIHVITGWKLPDEDAYQKVLTEQMCKKVKEDYFMLNKDEIEYAFRKHSVKDWGKSFNLSLVDEVLIPFLNHKKELKNFIDRLPKEEKLLPGKSDWKLVIEENYQQFLSGSYKVELWPWEMYDEFVKEKMMEADVYEDWLKAAYIKLIAAIPENNEQERRHHDIRSQGKAHHAVIELAKRLAIELLFQTAKQKNIKNLFYKK